MTDFLLDNLQAENRSQHGDLSLIKELAEEVLCVLEGPARSSDRLETPEGDTKDGQNVTTETPDPNTSQPGPSSDLTTGLISSNLLYFFIVLSLTILETTELVDPDSVILEIPEIQEPDDNLMESSIPARKPQMSDYETSKLISSGSFGLLITPTGHIKVADFGLSTVGVMTPKTNTHKESVEDITREFQDREECGTPSYMAPEIILKKGYGRPADWWSMGIILHRLLLGYVPFHGDTLTELHDNIVGGDINWDWDCAPPPDAQDLINDLLRTNPAQRIGTGGAFEIKSHPFLSDIDFDNLLSQKPEYIPQLVSDVDTSLFINHADPDNQMVSEEEDTSVDNESLYFQNFTSSSERLSKLCTIATRITNNEDPKSPLVCTPASDINIPGMQKKSFPEPDRDDAITSLPSSSPLSGYPCFMDPNYVAHGPSLYFRNFNKKNQKMWKRGKRDEAENRSQHGDLSLIKELAEKVLCVLEGPARSSDRLETPEGDTKDGQNVTTETPDPNTSQPGPSSDLTTGLISSNLLYFFIVLSLTILETTELVDPDSVILEIPEIQEPDDECGTPSYMAPEIILKKGYGRPADWWSMGIILHRLLLGYVPFHGDTLTELHDNIVGGDINWDWDCAPPPDAQDLINDLLRTNPAQRIGTGGAFEIKSHPFLSDIDFDNLLSQKPEYIPQLVSDVDTSLFINHADPDNQMVSEEEDTSVDNESLYFQNFTSSSERLSKLCTIATRITNNEDPKSPLVCTPASDINIPGMQKKSFPEPDRDDAITSLPSSSPLSEQEKSENVEKGKKRRGSIFRRILSSCRRGLSRAARVFTCCCRSPTDI
ncbi:uncharacterized protein [Dendrobates tinctorius]|uniref:uncharacterized protein n=1 Tax=Dendrobates tinctorius TaxID=92724 RepID=UPI003CC998A9